MSRKVTPDHYPEIVEIYNTEGKAAAYALIRNQYGIKNPTCLMKRIKESGQVVYNPETDRFEDAMLKETVEESIFMNLDELCNEKVLTTENKVSETARVKALESMIHSLISDRLLELSKYIVLDPIGHRVLIDRTAMLSDGYQVNIN